MSRFVEDIEGPRTAYTDFTDGTATVRFVYQTVCWTGPDLDSVKRKYNEVMGEVHGLLPDGGLVIWRQRPIFERAGKRWGLYMRFATSPPLPAEFWEREGKPEGEPAKALP